MKGLSFKKQPKETGLRAVGSPIPNTDIKLNGKRFGYLCAPTWQTKDGKWGVYFMAYKTEPDDNPNCDWRWLSAKDRFDSESDARQWMKDRIATIMQQHQLRFED